LFRHGTSCLGRILLISPRQFLLLPPLWTENLTLFRCVDERPGFSPVEKNWRGAGPLYMPLCIKDRLFSNWKSIGEDPDAWNEVPANGIRQKKMPWITARFKGKRKGKRWW